MKISCNKLKTYINNSEQIDWITIWDTFTIRVAEVEKIELKGKETDNIVVSEILECVTHPKKDKYHILKVDNGRNHLSILCGAPNVRVGMKAALVNVGGKVNGFEITEKEIAGIKSQGMLLAMDELGIGDDHEGIIELPSNYEVGCDIKKYLPIEDIIVEIDNKSLTNRPDLWGHYGIAREIAAITNQKLIPLDIEEIINNKTNLDIKIKSEYCNRYIGLKIDNISKYNTPLEIQIFLYYVGMRSLSLIVDLTNLLMLELGTPMHAFASNKVKKIEIGMANDQDKFVTLDGCERILTSDNLMIKSNDEYYAIAGVMGGLDSEIASDTSSIILESANFDATSVRKTATYLGLRTEASARYEKALDPNMCEIATKRFLKLLKNIDSNILLGSNMTDVYPNKLSVKKIKLNKEKLHTYLGLELSTEDVIKILNSLEFEVNNKKDYYDVTVPTFRATKDISIEEDLIEEISRIYGYENIIPKPLRVDLVTSGEEFSYDLIYQLKYYLATKFSLNEVHTYLWNNNDLISRLGIIKDNVKILNRSEDNILRDDMLYSMIDVAINNAKYKENFGIYEIGTVIQENTNKKSLAIMLMDEDKYIRETYDKVKKIILSIFESFKNLEIDLLPVVLDGIYENALSLGIFIDDKMFGHIGVVNKPIIKKKCLIYANINFDLFVELEKKTIVYEKISKFPNVNLDYTIIAPKDYKYQMITEVLDDFDSPILLKREFIGSFMTEFDIRYTFRYTVGSFDKTLASEDLEMYKNNFIQFIRKNNFEIIE